MALAIDPMHGFSLVVGDIKNLITDAKIAVDATMLHEQHVKNAVERVHGLILKYVSTAGP